MTQKSDPQAVPAPGTEPPVTVVLVRHGHVDHQSADPILLGPFLTTVGRKQVVRLARRLADETFQHIYVSTLNRAIQTADAIQKYHRDTPCTVTPEIQEVTHFHFTPDARPDSKALLRRVQAESRTMHRFAYRLREVHQPGDRVLLVCHGNIIRCLVSIFACRNPKRSILMDVNNAAVTVVDLWPRGDAILRLLNCVKHLPADLLTW